jgi:hypothetical protein
MAVLRSELKEIADAERIVTLLLGWRSAMKSIRESLPQDAAAFLLVLDPSKMTLGVTSYTRAELMTKAQIEYRLRERETDRDPSIQVVLVSVSKVDELRSAYPNFYVDTETFVGAVNRELELTT